MNHDAYLALGANLGDRLHTMVAAADRIDQIPETRVVAYSNLYETKPVGGPPGQPAYLNAVVRIETRRRPHDLLGHCLRIEAELGRRRNVPNSPRTIDIDVLLYDDVVLETSTLIVPHPRLHLRGFVLCPLMDLAPQLLHPALRATICELLARLPKSQRTDVRRITDTNWG
ncbi:MAG: 2-amino-4-hydroxy-6-hydroxymethyldihydropteridine diphosphokinase [Phycisphaerae bacterium]|nr:2-amino-4-hydroxy-6-hydroxymethyldihydropteridine diphosphokinase [Phycisphaerae bacterium]